MEAGVSVRRLDPSLPCWALLHIADLGQQPQHSAVEFVSASALIVLPAVTPQAAARPQATMAPSLHTPCPKYSTAAMGGSDPRPHGAPGAAGLDVHSPLGFKPREVQIRADTRRDRWWWRCMAAS